MSPTQAVICDLTMSSNQAVSFSDLIPSHSEGRLCEVFLIYTSRHIRTALPVQR